MPGFKPVATMALKLCVIRKQKSGHCPFTHKSYLIFTDGEICTVWSFSVSKGVFCTSVHIEVYKCKLGVF